MTTSSVTGADRHSLGRSDTGVCFGILLEQWMCIYVFLHSVMVEAVPWSHPASREPYHLVRVYETFREGEKTV
jgi:hypothetical protein